MFKNPCKNDAQTNIVNRLGREVHFFAMSQLQNYYSSIAEDLDYYEHLMEWLKG